jgi:hypothetical protein
VLKSWLTEKLHNTPNSRTVAFEGCSFAKVHVISGSKGVLSGLLNTLVSILPLLDLLT